MYMCMYTYVKQLRNLTSQFFIHSFFCSSVMSISGVFFIERICVNNFSLANIMQQTLFQQHAHTLEICKCRLKIAFAIKEILHLFFTLELLTYISIMYIYFRYAHVLNFGLHCRNQIMHYILLLMINLFLDAGNLYRLLCPSVRSSVCPI